MFAKWRRSSKSSPKRHTSAAQFFEGAIGGESSFAKVVLEHQPGVVSATAIAADGIDAVPQMKIGKRF